ncbi:sugar kinase [Iocasia frigidifontis]|uniref:Sugar kinase n=1 Tax=Iocasia fonsfrigidae TaxID=2682810 RepID=A0A8A7KDP8_9FIRM|nr:sugar kinase [Iocasia fonsfrigidae]QTL97728.1 sugar kinase [Iocasia fonsfrigidae]
MPEVLIMGEMLVEIMRPDVGIELYKPGLFKGPYPSGAPAIFIDTVARLGHDTAIIGGVGKDDFGKSLLDRFKRDGVNCDYVLQSEERATGVAFVTYFSDGSRKFIFHMGNTPAVEAKMPDVSRLKDVKYFHIMGCSLMSNKDFAQEILKTMRALVKQGTKVSFDPNIRKELLTDDSIYAVVNEVVTNTSVFLPGIEELLMITEEKNIKEAIKKSFRNPNLEVLALKNGSKGSTIYTRNQVVEMGVYEVEQLDPTGAGDCFDGAFIAGLVDGKNVLDAAKMGAAAGAINAAAFGPMEGDISIETVNKIIKDNKVKK